MDQSESNNKTYDPLGIGTGTLLGGRYEIVKKLGAGGMSAVYEALDRNLENEQVALKILAPQVTNSEVVISRFRNELIVTRKLTHPNIVRTYEFGAAGNGHYYITMELIEGTSLDTLVKGGRKLPLNQILYILRAVLNAIKYAHAMGVVHRDLKPGNILISRGSEVKLMDFGLARSTDFDERFTQTGECVGTPFYMAPEQIQGHQNDHRVDLYACGIIAYELALGKVPFNKDTWYDLATEIINEPLPDLPEDGKNFPAWFKDWLIRGTAKNPDDRYGSAEEMIAPIKEITSDDSDLNALFKTIKKKSVKKKKDAERAIPQPANETLDISKIAPLLFFVSFMVFLFVAINVMVKEPTENTTHTVIEVGSELSNIMTGESKN